LDARLAALERWLAGPLAGPDFSIACASADASFRRYFRVTLPGGRSFVAMDAPPDREDCRPFLRIAGLLRAAGVHAPSVHAEDLAQGFLLLEDLGSTTYLDALTQDPGKGPALMRDAIGALIQWQLASRPGELPTYDEALLRRELALFPEWYAQRHRARPLSAAQASGFESVCALLVSSALAQPTVYVHRDYMPRNLMLSEPNPGVLDWTVRYWERAAKAHLPVHADFAEFWRAVEWMGLQRHLKVLGIFARLTHRDGKEKYAADTPRFVAYARAVARRYAALSPLARLLDELER